MEEAGNIIIHNSMWSETWMLGLGEKTNRACMWDEVGGQIKIELRDHRSFLLVPCVQGVAEWWSSCRSKKTIYTMEISLQSFLCCVSLLRPCLLRSEGWEYALQNKKA